MSDTTTKRQTLVIQAAAGLAGEMCLHLGFRLKHEYFDHPADVALQATRIKLTVEYLVMALRHIEACCRALTRPLPSRSEDEDEDAAAEFRRSFLELDVLAEGAVHMAEELNANMTTFTSKQDELEPDKAYFVDLEMRTSDVIGKIAEMELACHCLLDQTLGRPENHGRVGRKRKRVQ